MHLAYVTDQVLPQTATDTEQLVTMSAAFGDTGCNITLVSPSHWFKKDHSLDEIAEFYNVHPSFKLHFIKGAVPFIRGIEKIVHAIVSAFKIARWDNIDLVYTRNLPVVIAFLLFSDKKIIYETYRPWPDQNKFMTPLFRWFNKTTGVKGLVLHSKLAAESYKKIGFEVNKLLVAHNGVDLNRFDTGITKEQARNQLDWDLQKTIVTYTGRVNKDKGLDLMLKLARDHQQVDFVIVGSEQEGVIEREAAALENVIIYPWQSIEDIPIFLLASDILFIPPTAKPLKQVGNTVLPMKTFIYLASGRAILGPKTPDLEEVLTDKLNALLVPPDDYSTLREALTQLVENKNYQNRIGQQAKEDSKRFSWKNRARYVSNFIEKRTKKL